MKKNNDDFVPFDFKDLDEMIEKLFGNIGNLPNLGEINPNTHHHSIKYRFGTGMDKPEIIYNGGKIDNETLNKMFETLGINPNNIPTQKLPNTTSSIPEIDVKEISVSDDSNRTVVQYNDTYFETVKDDNSFVVTIELPGIQENQIILSQTGKTLTIMGENDHSAYKAELDLDFSINKDHTLIEGNNGIFRIQLSR